MSFANVLDTNAEMNMKVRPIQSLAHMSTSDVSLLNF